MLVLQFQADFCSIVIRPNKKMCVYGHMSTKYSVSVGIFFIGKTGNSRSRLRNSISRHLLKLFYDELCSFSTFFVLNFDKKLAVE
jgi:hypothetical protein